MGVMTALPLNAAFGGDPGPPPPGPTAIIDDLTGNREAAATWTLPPTTLAIPG